MREQTLERKLRRAQLWKRIKNDRLLYLMLIPILAWYLIFCYLPMGGITLAFRNYRYDTGLWHSPWVGFDHFKTMFGDAEFWRAFKNTIVFSLGKLAFHFPVPILVAILLNEIRHPRVKKFFQTVFTFPHFISWVVLSGILINMFASNGIVNQLLGTLGLEQVAPLMSLSSFRPFIWVSNIWKEFGFNTIVYLAAITSIDPSLYESAVMDGANRLQQIIHITLPGMLPIIMLMLLLNIGSVMNANFDQIFNLYSPTVYKTGDVLDTLVYRIGLVNANYSLSTAIGIFKSMVSMLLVGTSYYSAYKFAGYRIF